MYSAHLLEPYRSALQALAFSEGLMTAYPPGAEVSSDSLRVGADPRIQRAVLQTLVLFDDVTILWHDHLPEELDRKGISGFIATGLRDLGVVRYLDEPWREWGGAQTISDAWRIEQQDMDECWPLVTSQLEARGKLFHYGLLRLVRAHRLGDKAAVPVILSVIPQHLHDEAKAILTNDRVARYTFDLPLFTTLHEVRSALAIARGSTARLVGTAVTHEPVSSAPAEAADELVQVVVDALLEEDLRFPQPHSLRDALILRSRPEIADFRATFFPWLASLTSDGERRRSELHGEVLKTARYFKRLPRLEKFVSITEYVGIGVGALEAAYGLTGPGIITGVIALGVGHVAKRLRRASPWMSLTT